MKTKYPAALAVLIASFIGLSTPSASAAPPPEGVVQLLVKPKPGMPEAALHAILSSTGAQEHDLIPALDVRVIRVPQHASQKLIQALERNKQIECQH